MKKAFWKRQRARITNPPGTSGQFIDGNSAPFGEMELDNISLSSIFSL